MNFLEDIPQKFHQTTVFLVQNEDLDVPTKLSMLEGLHLKESAIQRVAEYLDPRPVEIAKKKEVDFRDFLSEARRTMVNMLIHQKSWPVLRQYISPESPQVQEAFEVFMRKIDENDDRIQQEPEEVSEVNHPAVQGEIQEEEGSVFKTLLKHRAPIDAVPVIGFTPLHFAAQNGHVDMVKLLLQHGAIVDSVDIDHFTPLHFAARQGDNLIVEILIKAGASVSSKDKDGQLTAKKDLSKRVVYAINCGGPEHVGEGRIHYKADGPMDDTVDSNFGQRYFFVNAHDQDRVLYQTERYSIKSFTYSFPVKEGHFVLILKFSEVYFTYPGGKIFNVNLNGIPIVKQLDIFREAQGVGAALDKYIEFTISKGLIYVAGRKTTIGSAIKIEFAKGPADNPKVNALAILTGGVAGLPHHPAPVQIDEQETNTLRLN